MVPLATVDRQQESESNGHSVTAPVEKDIHSCYYRCRLLLLACVTARRECPPVLMHEIVPKHKPARRENPGKVRQVSKVWIARGRE